MTRVRYLQVAGVAVLLVGAGCATTPAAKKPSTPAEWRAEMQPPLTQDEASRVAGGLTLAQAVEIGAERNPQVAAARARWFAAIKVEPQAVTPPDPMLQAGYQFKTGYKFRTGRTRVEPWQANVGLTQQLPWPQKLTASGHVAGIEADVSELQYEAAVRDLIVDVKDAYYELYYLDQALLVTEKIEQMLRNDAILAYSELTVGRTQINEAFRAESQAAQLGYDRILLAEQRAAQAERIRSLLNLPPDTVVGPVRHAPVYGVASPVDELFDRADQYAEVLKIKGLETQRAAYETFLAKLSRIPDVNVGFNFVDRYKPRITGREKGEYASGLYSAATGSGMTPGPLRPKGSGNNQFIGLFSMNLPIFQWRNQALIQEQKALEQAMRLDALTSLNEVRSAVAQTYFQVRLTDRLVNLYDETLLPQAESVMQQAEIFFRNDQASFSNVIETTLAYQNFTLARLRAVADHGQAIGRLERVLGTTAEPRSEEPSATLDSGEAEEAMPTVSAGNDVERGQS